MEMINIGVVNLVMSEKLKESYFKENLISESEKKVLSNEYDKYLNTIKQSPILQLEFKVYNSIDNKEISDSSLASRYIDKNIQLFEVYTLDEVEKEHNKLKSFISENVDIKNNEKYKLYESINVLIEESLKSSDEVDVDNVHESFSIVLEHIQKSKSNVDSNKNQVLDEQVIELAINKFNDKYNKMTSEEFDLFKKLIKSDEEEKRSLFEEYKKENIETLNSLKEDNNNERIDKSLNKLNEMKFNTNDCDENIISLFELKNGLV